ncbi:MAG TPA: hypothetical protein VGU71_12400 [Candidatus Dormibacteraeota bacterium]|nr:hypothetical protein [Candidatus Dormibacteraeota bacterium]
MLQGGSPGLWPAGLKRFAIVLPTRVLAAMNVLGRLGKVPSETLETVYFEGVDEARVWLTG